MVQKISSFFFFPRSNSSEFYPSFFIKVYIFVQQNAWTLRFFKVIISFKITIIENQNTASLPDL